MEIKEFNQCVKMRLPNGKIVDVLSPVLDKMYRWLQDEAHKPESGGFIVGYQHKGTGNVSLETISEPGTLDKCNRIRFFICDPTHKDFLRKAGRKKSYYMGVWHTHPESSPTPSSIDYTDWYDTLDVDQTGSQYAFFIIAGTHEWKLWTGDFSTKTITEAVELPKGRDGIYEKQGGDTK